jgi:4a-hydroxytetrahydrobiopterin dehydratase
MDKALSEKKCMPCNKGTLPIKGEELQKLQSQLKNDWKVVGEHHLEKVYLFQDFREALSFVDKVGKIAEEEGHHPDIYLSYGKVMIQLWTHKINGLSESDFIIAAKCDVIN